MATFTQTITNSVNIFGPVLPNIWNSITWGTDDWGYSSGTAVKVFKLVEAQDLSISEAFSKTPFVTWDFGTMTVTQTISTLDRYDAFGDFKYVRAGDLGVDGFSKTADGSDGWSKVSDGSDGWTKT